MTTATSSTRHAADATASAVTRVAVIGAGPRGVGWLERFAASRSELDAGPVVVHLVDPFPIGAGRIWRDDQPGHLRVNSRAADVTMFTDATCAIEGPVRPGPSLLEWAAGVRACTIADAGLDPPAEPGLAAELESLDADAYPSRRLHARYLAWFGERAIASLGPGARVVRHTGRADRVMDLPDGAQRVELSTGRSITADVVVYATGHSGRRPAAAPSGPAAFAAAHGAAYLAPAFAADVHVDALPAGEPVVIRGMGLSAVDLVTLLTTGRGGRFAEDDDGRLRYAPSSREPRLWLGSRRGVPYHATTTVAPAAPVPAARALTAESVRDLARRHGRVDYGAHVRPLLHRELVRAHVHDLVAGDGGAAGRAARFLERYDRAPDGEALDAIVAEFVPDVARRFDPAHLDRPLGSAGRLGVDDLQRTVRAYVLADLERHERSGHGEAAVLEAITRARHVLDALADDPIWTTRSIEHGLPVDWRGCYDFVSCGPPPERLRELVALNEAGVVGFLGGGLAVSCDEATGEFVATGANLDGEVRARALVDAWQPPIDAGTTDDPALADLLSTGAGRLRCHVAGDRAVTTGRLEVRRCDARVVRADGSPHPSRFAIGPATSAPFVGAFSRPGSDAASFRQNDAVARAVLRELAARRVAWARGDAAREAGSLEAESLDGSPARP